MTDLRAYIVLRRTGEPGRTMPHLLPIRVTRRRAEMLRDYLDRCFGGDGPHDVRYVRITDSAEAPP